MARTPPRKIALALALALAAPACDRGWHYRATQGTAVPHDSRNFDVPSPKGVAVQVSANVFTDDLQVQLTLKNVGANPIELVSPRLAVLDARSVSLPVGFLGRQENCRFSDNVLRLSPGEACRLSTFITINPRVRGILFATDNPDLEHITIKLQSTEPKPFPDLEIPMKRM